MIISKAGGRGIGRKGESRGGEAGAWGRGDLERRGWGERVREGRGEEKVGQELRGREGEGRREDSRREEKIGRERTRQGNKMDDDGKMREAMRRCMREKETPQGGYNNPVVGWADMLGQTHYTFSTRQSMLDAFKGFTHSFDGGLISSSAALAGVATGGPCSMPEEPWLEAGLDQQERR